MKRLPHERISVTDFPLDTGSSNLSEIILEARYPEIGDALNAESEMTAYILDGEVVLTVESLETLLRKGDAALIGKNRKYHWQPKGEVALLIFSTPPWTPEQQRTA